MSDRPKVVFFGSDAICLPFLNYLIAEGAEQCELRAVISQPDRRQGRGKKLQPNPVAAWASEKGLELLQPAKPTRELADWLVAEQVAVSFVMAYGHFLPKPLREAASNGIVNFHGSILPAYRGASPVETAIAQGELETGVALMQVVKEMDAGGVADVEKVCIEKTDTGPMVRAKIGEAVVPLMRRNLAATLSGRLNFVPQDTSRVTFCRKISKEDGALEFSLSASQIDARLRAFTPWPGGYFDHGSERIKVGRVSVVEGEVDAAPGTVIEVADGIRVATGAGSIWLRELQRAGGRMLPAGDFLRGYTIAEGDLLKGGEAEPLVTYQP